MITVTTTQTRTVSTAPFFTEAVPEIAETFRQVVSSFTQFAEPPAFTLSEDQLQHVSVAKYQTQADLDAFIATVEATIPGFFVMRDQISKAYGIDVQRVVTSD